MPGKRSLHISTRNFCPPTGMWGVSLLSMNRIATSVPLMANSSYVRFPKNLQKNLAEVFLFPIFSSCAGFTRLIKFNRQCLLNWAGCIIVNCCLFLTSTSAAFMRKKLLIPAGLSGNWNGRFQLPSMNDCCWQREEQIWVKDNKTDGRSSRAA